MNVLAADQIDRITGGAWQQRPVKEIDGVGIDTREPLGGKLFVAITGAAHDGHAFVDAAIEAGAVAIAVEAGRRLPPLRSDAGVLVVEDTRRMLASLAAAHRRALADAQVIAITGSVGKTTTKRLLDGVLGRVYHGTAAPRSFNNDIGVPLTLLSAGSDDRYVIVEVGTNSPGEIGHLARIVAPDIAIITAIGRSHLERLGSLEAVAAEKASLLEHLRPGGLAILPADEPLLGGVASDGAAAITFGESAGADIRLTARGGSTETGWWLEVDGRERFGLSLPGRHNARNALAAIAVGRHLGLAPEQIDAGLRAVAPEGQRFATTLLGDITIHDDAYNANPESMRASLDVFAEVTPTATRRIVVLGDMLELGDATVALHRELGGYVVDADRRQPISHAILVGAAARHAAGEISRSLGDERTIAAADAIEAGRRLAEIVRPGDAVLLKASRGIGLERVIDELRRSIAGK